VYLLFQLNCNCLVIAIGVSVSCWHTFPILGVAFVAGGFMGLKRYLGLT